MQHLGHLRNYVSQDIIRRILRDYFNYHVELVQNVTDGKEGESRYACCC